MNRPDTLDTEWFARDFELGENNIESADRAGLANAERLYALHLEAENRRLLGSLTECHHCQRYTASHKAVGDVPTRPEPAKGENTLTDAQCDVVRMVVSARLGIIVDGSDLCLTMLDANGDAMPIAGVPCADILRAALVKP